MKLHLLTDSSGDAQDAFPESALRELKDGLAVLWRAYNYARDADAELWQFAVEIQQFYDLGLTKNELRWLVAKGHAKHARETSIDGDVRRSFEPADGLTFSPTNALVLTELGTAFASHVFATKTEEPTTGKRTSSASESSAAPTEGNGDSRPQTALKPKWDARLRELRFGGMLVKRFRVPADSQEAVLSVFEEEAWPDYIDDPLPSVADSVPKQRLHNAIKRLNANQTNCLIHFFSNGQGDAIGWNSLAADDAYHDPKLADRVNGHRTKSRISPVHKQSEGE